MGFLEWWNFLVVYGPFVVFALAAVGFVLYGLVGRLRQPVAGPLHQVYTRVEPTPGTRLTLERVVFGRGPRMTWVKIGADQRYLHVKLVYSTRFRDGFSVPLNEITAEPDRFPLMVLAPDVVRLSLAGDRSRPMLVSYLLFERLSAATQGGLKLGDAAAKPSSIHSRAMKGA